MSDPKSTTGAPSDLLTPRDLKACAALVERVVETKEAGSSERQRWEGVLARLRGESGARPASPGPAIVRTLLDVVTQGPEVAERAVTTLAEVLYRSGDTEACALLRRAAPSIRNARSQSGGVMLGGGRGGGGGGEDARMVDDRAIEWHEPAALTEPVVLTACMEPVFSRLVRELKNVEVFLDFGIEAPTRLLFYGPPGTGKTLAAKWIGTELDAPVALVQIAGVMIPYVGATEKNLRRVFDDFARRPDGILFLDEIDGLSTRRDEEGSGSYSKGGQTVTTVLLQLLDSLPKNRIVIAATNFHGKIDPALDRRLATKIEFFYPDAAARTAMLQAWWKKLAVDDAARARLVADTERRSGDFLRNVAMSAARMALSEDGVDKSKRRVLLEHVVAALAEAVPPGELRQAGGAGDKSMN